MDVTSWYQSLGSRDSGTLMGVSRIKLLGHIFVVYAGLILLIVLGLRIVFYYWVYYVFGCKHRNHYGDFGYDGLGPFCGVCIWYVYI